MRFQHPLSISAKAKYIKKCLFGVQAGKFLGFMLMHRGIKANPDRCSMVINMRSLSNVTKVQQLYGRINSLSIFLSKLDGPSHSFIAHEKARGFHGWKSVR